MRMTAPPIVDPGADEGTRDPLLGPSLPDCDSDDPRSARPDPADSVVAIGEVPAVQPPLRPERRRLLGEATDRARGWIVTAVLTLIGGVLRFTGLGDAVDRSTPGGNGAPLFDEKYYVVHAAEVLRNGGVEDNQAYGVIVHPPLGKQLIAVGEWLFGYTPFGWRFATALAGTIMIAIVIRLVRRMTASTLLGGIAGVLMICDSLSHVLSRTAILDQIQALFVIAAFACLVADRDQVRSRLAAASFGGFLDEPAKGPRFWKAWGEKAGPALGFRWWRFGTGLMIGLSMAVKYSGVYYAVAFGIMMIVWDITARREVGIRNPISAVVRRDLFPGLWSLAVVPLVTYVLSWWAWFFSETAFPRHSLCADPSNPCGGWAAGSTWQTIAGWWDNQLWQWTFRMLDFHSNLVTPADGGHPWESKPWTWPMGTRPVLTYVGSGQTCSDGATDCVARIFIISLPAMWFIAFFIAAWALWKAVGRLDWRYASVLVGYGAGYLPWFFNLDRQMYFFYAAPLAPFLVIGITLVLGDILGKARQAVERKYLLIAVVAIYVGIVVANFLWMLPVLNGTPITAERLRLITMIPSWG